MMDSSNQTPNHSRSAWLNVGLVVLGLALAILVLNDPFHLHPIDEWMRGELDDPDHPAEQPHAEHGVGSEEKQLWTCGMHPQVVRDEPGQCPICGMDLTPMQMDDETEAAPDGASQSSEGKQLWTCGMHPQVVQDEPGQCPICGMDLTPMEMDGDDHGAAPGSHAEHQGTAIRIDPVVVQNMNVTTAPIARRALRREIRTVGYLDYDQEKMVNVTTKYSGFVEKVYVNYIGQPVHKGQPLFEIYSPELIQTEQELLAAVEYVERMKDAPSETQSRARALLEAARTRLTYWDVTAEQIQKLQETGKVFRTLTVFAPADGIVMKRMSGLEGMAVKPAMELLHFANLSSLWLKVEVFEDQFPWVDAGSSANITLTYFPGETFTGKVRYIEPEVSEKTRTVALTLEVPNPDRRLRVGMYATVVFDPVIVEDALAVPIQSVIRTGERSVVVVDLGDGRFAPREVTLGPEGQGYVQIFSGVDEGETVVTSAQFLIDSESNLRSAVQKMVSGHQH